MNNDKIKKLEDLYKARNEYRKLEKEVYDLLSSSEVGSYYILPDVEARIGEQSHYNYARDFRAYMNELYIKERKKKYIKHIKKLYVAFYKEV